MTYGFIGLGNMATAIIGGMVASPAFRGAEIVGYDPDGEKCSRLAEQYGVKPLASEREVLESDVVVLAVKPQVLPDLLPTHAPHIAPDTLVLTIAAGKQLSFYEGILGKGVPVVRAMPNINALVASATVAICGGSSASAAHMEIASRLFSTVGRVFVLEEEQFSAFIGISGSAVAFAYLYMDAVSRAGAENGIDPKTALEITASAVRGSGKMVQKGGIDPQTLVKMVCSPGGTTIEGVSTLREGGFEDLLHRAVQAVVDKDKRLQ